MNCRIHSKISNPNMRRAARIALRAIPVVAVFLLLPLTANAQTGGSPFDTGLMSIENLFTGMVAKVASLVAIVIGGYSFAHGEPGAKKTLAAVAVGSGVAVLAVNV